MAEVNTIQHGDKPVTLWDVDGVLLVQARTEDQQMPSRFIPHPTRILNYYVPEHGEWIRQFIGPTDAYYNTAHNDRAHADIGQHLDLPELGWINYNRSGQRYFPEWYDAVQYYFPGRPIAWISDDHNAKFHNWSEDRNENEAPTLLVDVDMDVGLEYRHIEQVTSWLGRLSVERLI